MEYKIGDKVQILCNKIPIRAGIISHILTGIQNKMTYIKFEGSDYLHEIDRNKTVEAIFLKEKNDKY